MWLLILLQMKSLVSSETESNSCGCGLSTYTSSVIPSNYNKYIIPQPGGKPLNVSVFIDVMDLDEIREETMDFRFQIYLTDEWKDDRLNLSQFQEGVMNSVPRDVTDNIWKPDLVFDNTKKGEFFYLSLPNNIISVHPDGTLSRFIRYNLQVSCRMDLHRYPMDSQQCFFQISSLVNPTSKLLLMWSEKRSGIKFQNKVHPLKYELRKYETSKTVVQWTVGKYTNLFANFTFVRCISSHVLNVYVPSSLVVILSFLSFWLDRTAVPARVTLGLTSLLTISTQVVQSRSNLPPVNYMTALDVWLFVCISLVFLTLLEYAFIYQFTEESSVPQPMKESVKVKGRDEAWSEQKKPDIQTLPQEIKKSCLGNIKVKTWNLDHVCRALFPTAFLLFSIIYWTYYLYY